MRLPSNRYADLFANGIELVAEVGIGNYKIYFGKLLLQVHVKPIYPASGQLIGRARASGFARSPVASYGQGYIFAIKVRG